MRTSSPIPPAPPRRASSRAWAAAPASSRTDTCTAGPLQYNAPRPGGHARSQREGSAGDVTRERGPKQRTDLRRDRSRLHLAERREDELVPERRQGIVGRRELEFLRGAGHGGVLQVSSMRLRDGTRNYARQPWTERVHMGPPTSMSNADVIGVLRRVGTPARAQTGSHGMSWMREPVQEHLRLTFRMLHGSCHDAGLA